MKKLSQINAPISGHMFTSYSRSFILKRAACRVKANISDAIDWYIIDPDGPGGKASFQAYCSMTDKEGDGVTVISHDTENRTHVDGCDPQGCYERYAVDIHRCPPHPVGSLDRCIGTLREVH